jgi:pimeloyl-ACP methyl ester carboxylesterase
MPFTPSVPRTHWQATGDGPPLLLVPGLGAGSRLFGTLPRRFARAGLRCLTFDPPGLPPSETPAGAWSLAGAASVLVAVLDAAGADRAHLVGTSLGGKVALVAAARFPARVATLTMLAAAAATTERARRVHRSWQVLGQHLPDDEFGPAIAPFLFGRTFLAQRPDVVDDILRAMRLTPAARALLLAQAQALAEFDGEPFAALVRAPALCVAGSEDPLTPAAEVRATAAAIPGARFLEIEGAGHSLLLESPRTFDAIVDFVGGVGPGGS